MRSGPLGVACHIRGCPGVSAQHRATAEHGQGGLAFPESDWQQSINRTMQLSATRKVALSLCGPVVSSDALLAPEKPVRFPCWTLACPITCATSLIGRPTWARLLSTSPTGHPPYASPGAQKKSAVMEAPSVLSLICQAGPVVKRYSCLQPACAASCHAAPHEAASKPVGSYMGC